MSSSLSLLSPILWIEAPKKIWFVILIRIGASDFYKSLHQWLHVGKMIGRISLSTCVVGWIFHQNQVVVDTRHIMSWNLKTQVTHGAVSAFLFLKNSLHSTPSLPLYGVWWIPCTGPTRTPSARMHAWNFRTTNAWTAVFFFPFWQGSYVVTRTASTFLHANANLFIWFDTSSIF